jgi:curved DNA-binding protein CbpA
MRTLYDFLGALPDDDAEGLRAAFREAVKGAHPDLHPGDAEAALRFRQIVRANEILSDTRQRATYDRLLQVARLAEEAATAQAAAAAKQATAAAINRIAISVAYVAIALAGVLAVGVAGYRLVLPVAGTPLAPAQMTQVVRHEPTLAAAVTTGVADTRTEAPGRMDRHDLPEAVGASNKLDETPNKLDEMPENLQQAAAPGVIAVAHASGSDAASADAPAMRDFAITDAQHYREKGVRAYRSGDLYLALVDFDLAIQLDPGFSDAYIDRAIVFYRMGDQKRAFADMAQARRIQQETYGNKTLPTASAR